MSAGAVATALSNVPLNEAANANGPVSSVDSSPASVSEPLHQGDAKHDLEHQRILLQQKLAAKEGSFVSPTDNMLSPCTAKLQAQKKKQFGKTKPKLLHKAFAKVAAQENDVDKSSKPSDKDSPF